MRSSLSVLSRIIDESVYSPHSFIEKSILSLVSISKIVTSKQVLSSVYSLYVSPMPKESIGSPTHFASSQEELPEGQLVIFSTKHCWPNWQSEFAKQFKLIVLPITETKSPVCLPNRFSLIVHVGRTGPPTKILFACNVSKLFPFFIS